MSSYYILGFAHLLKWVVNSSGCLLQLELRILLHVHDRRTYNAIRKQQLVLDLRKSDCVSDLGKLVVET
jgi:hypothetical protein